MRNFLLPITILFCILLSSCGTQRHITPAPEHYQTLTQKANLTLQIDQHKYTLGCTIWMWKDQLTIFSLQPVVGMEAFRIEADKDSVIIIDKMNLKYTTVAYDWANRYISPAPSLKMIEEYITTPIDEQTPKKGKKRAKDNTQNLIQFWMNRHQLSIQCQFSQREYDKLTSHRRLPLKKYKRVTLREILPI